MGTQSQRGDDNYNHIASHDYMLATTDDASTLSTGGDLDFHHLMAMMTLKITGAPTGYTASADNAPVALTLTADGIGYNFKKTLKLNGSWTDGAVTLQLSNITWGASGFTAHLMIIPTNLTGTAFTVSVRCNDGNTYQYTTPQVNKKYVKGMRYTATLNGSDGWMNGNASYNNNTVASGNLSGEGKENNPYIISTAADLKYFQEQVAAKTNNNTYEGKYIRLDTDIKVDAAVTWTPIGTGMAHPFKGHFDGAGHTIYGTLRASNSQVEFGFFGRITESSVENLHIAANVTATSGQPSNVGGVAGYMGTKSTISNCSNSGAITAGPSDGLCTTGGIAGYNSGSISNCTNRGTVTGSSRESTYANYVGGLVGDNIGTIHQCLNASTGAVAKGNNGSNNYVGGLAGRNSYSGRIYNCCTNLATVDGAAASSSNPDNRIGGGDGDGVLNCTDSHTPRTDN